MIKRRATAAGLPASTCCHTFRATRLRAAPAQDFQADPDPPTAVA